MSARRDQTKLSVRDDLSASIVIFLVAIPLCLGIALASNTPPISGLITGIVGGIFVGFFSRSQLSVTGPAAGMSVIVLTSIESIGSFDGFLTALILGGILQYLLGLMRFGSVGHFIPSAVVKGVMASIGCVLILKQIPHGLGYDSTPEGSDSFTTDSGENTFTELLSAVQDANIGAVLIFVTGLVLLILLAHPKYSGLKISRYLPSALIVVLVSIIINYLLKIVVPSWTLSGEHMVHIPDFLSGEGSDSGGKNGLGFPDFSQWNNIEIYKTAILIAVIGSLETLISMEAIEKIDPHKRIVPLNHELKLQGLANTGLGFVGGLPLTSLIVRSSANASAGAKSKYSVILQGFWLLLALAFLHGFLNAIPLAALASILIFISYKLTKISLYKEIFKSGWSRFVPFTTTILVSIFSNLLIGTVTGLVVGIVFIIRENAQNAVVVTQDKQHYLIKLAKDVTFCRNVGYVTYYMVYKMTPT